MCQELTITKRYTIMFELDHRLISITRITVTVTKKEEIQLFFLAIIGS